MPLETTLGRGFGYERDKCEICGSEKIIYLISTHLIDNPNRHVLYTCEKHMEEVANKPVIIHDDKLPWWSLADKKDVLESLVYQREIYTINPWNLVKTIKSKIHSSTVKQYKEHKYEF